MTDFVLDRFARLECIERDPANDYCFKCEGWEEEGGREGEVDDEGEEDELDDIDGKGK